MALPKKLKNKLDAINTLYQRLDVLKGDVDSQPAITPIIEKALGSIDKAVDFLRQSDAKEAQAVLKVWDTYKPAERKRVPFEAFCLSAKIKTKVVIGLIMQAVVEHGNTATELMTAAAQPDIISKTIKLAKTKAGDAERQIILKHTGYVPLPKNTVLNNYGNVDARKQIANVNVRELDTDSDDIADGADAYNSERAALNPAPEEEVIDVVDVLGETDD